ncbi:hypothetical protein CFIMG_004554RA [Ceratocystis fimbriata CBS 114723]|uniref:Uncharacterized protein n=1 Tax=Ceratocystis fimbriata CBS 114723 TaxID=1035309 RepID=A0A2C5XBU8_9PEZI|nr:hypothetical protein CFIMG_004554RA [Ceratocystis fimbriata CBS 114723]
MRVCDHEKGAAEAGAKEKDLGNGHDSGWAWGDVMWRGVTWGDLLQIYKVKIEEERLMESPAALGFAGT